MKRIIKYISILIISMFILSVKVDALSASLSTNKGTVKKGETEQFTANVVTKYGASKDVTYEVKGTKQVDTGTTVSANGLLTVGVNETNTKLEVICKSVADITKTSKATVTVTE